MKISGSGRLSGGKIDEELHTAGSTRIEGDFECDGFKSSGSFRGSSNLIVHGDITSSGSFRLGGTIQGDGDLGSSGSTRVDGEILIKGYFKSSGSLRVGDNIQALEGINFSGSSNVKGNIFSERGILISGSTTIQGNVTGVIIDLGVGRARGSRGAYKHPIKVYGNVVGKKSVNLVKTLVQGNVKGRNVIIGRYTEVVGRIYYVDTIEVKDKTILNYEPIQIPAEELDRSENIIK